MTEANIQKALSNLESEAEKISMVQTDATEQERTLEVTQMSSKKLTINIKNTKHENPTDEEEEYGDCPSSADIQVVHDKGLPSLQGILKQRSISESSEEYSSSTSPTSCSPREDLFKKSVSFNSHINKTTYKPTQAVTTMKQALKSKRRRERKLQEKRQERDKRRHNSNGSECSSSDERDLKLNMESFSEEEHGEREDNPVEEVLEEEEECVANDGVKGTLKSEENLDAVPSEKDSGKASTLAKDVKSKLMTKQSPTVDDSDDDIDDEFRTSSKSEENNVISESSSVSQKDVDRTKGIKSGEFVKKNDLKINDLSGAGSKSATPVKGDNQSIPKSGAVPQPSPQSIGDSVLLSSGKRGKKKRKRKNRSRGRTSQDEGSGMGDQSASSDQSVSVSESEEIKSEEVAKEEVDENKSETQDKGETEREKTESAETKGSEGEKNDVETMLSWENRNGSSDEHKTQCAFNFSNAVMFDLDID